MRHRTDRSKPRRYRCNPVHRLIVPTLAATADPAPVVLQPDAADAEPLVPLPIVSPVAGVRDWTLRTLAVLALVFALSWAQALLIPLLLGLVISYTLYPVVAWLEAIRIPRLVATVAVMSGVIGALVLGTYSLRNEFQSIIEELPAATTKLAAGVSRLQGSSGGNLQKIQDAAIEVEKATSGAADPKVTPRARTTHVIVDKPASRLGDFLWDSSLGAFGAVIQAAMVAFLVFFLLLGGDTFKRKLVRLSGPTLSKRKITVHILNGINSSIQKYMLMLLTTNVLVGLLTWFVFWWLGFENAGAWAVAAGLLHLVPYLGPAVTAGATAMAAFMQFDSFAMAMLVSGSSLAIATVVGTFVTTWMVGRIANMNAAAVFVSLLFWGWLWGIWGMLLSIPIIVIVKVVSDHVEALNPVAELLGD